MSGRPDKTGTPRPRGLKPRLLILCGHEPTLDPRIDWTARAAVEAGWDVRLHGFTIGRVEPKFADPAEYRTTRGRAESAGGRARAVLDRAFRAGVLPRWPLVPLGLAAGLFAALWIFWRLVLAPWIILDWALEKAGLSRYVTLPVERAVRDLKDRLLAATAGAPRRWREGLRGYRWYFVELVLKQAAAALERFDFGDWKPDVIHANDPDCLFAAALLKARFAARLTYDAHEYGPDAYLLEPRPRALFYAYEGLMLRQVDAAVTVTPQIAAKFQARYRGRPAFAVVPNAAPTARDLRPLDDPFMRAAARGRVRVLFQGGFAPGRGLEELIEAWRSVDSDAAVLFVRGPETAYRDALVARARETGLLGASIFFLPSVPESELVASAANADVGVISYLSRVENHQGACPNKLSQYMQAGLPVVATDLPFVRSVVEAAGCGLVFDDRAPGAFAAALNRAIAEADWRRAAGEAGRAYARTRFNFSAFAPVLFALWDGREPPAFEAFSTQAPTRDDAPAGAARQDLEAEHAEFDALLALDVSPGVFGEADVRRVRARAAEAGLNRGPAASEAVEIQRALRLSDPASPEHDPRAALALFRRLAESGVAEAAHQLGVLLRDGRAGAADPVGAVQEFERAARAGRRGAWRSLADLHRRGGPGLKPDPARAAAAYEQALRQDRDLDAAVAAAALMLDGAFGEGQERRAADLLTEAWEDGHAGAAAELDRLIDRLGLGRFVRGKVRGAGAPSRLRRVW